MKEKKGRGGMKLETRDRLMELGIVIGAVRKMRGMSQEQLAEKIQISRSFLSMIEAPNTAQTFSLETLYSIADALEVRAGDLMNGMLLPEEARTEAAGGMQQERRELYFE